MEKQIMLAQANAVTQSRYNFSVIEKRCLYQVIRQVRRQFIETQTGERDLFNDLRIKLSAQMLAECRDEKHVREVYESLKKLRKRDIEIETSEMWMDTGYITFAKHDKRNNEYEVGVSSEILPYLVALADNFTTYDLTVAISLKSIYSQRFYEYCCQYKNREPKTFFFSVEELRKMLMLENKYPLTADFKKNVLDTAQKEIKDLYDKDQCDLWFEFAEKETKGRKILSYFFLIHTKEDEKNELDYQSVNVCIQHIQTILSEFFARDKKFVKRVVQQLQLHPDIATTMAEQLDKKILDYNKKSIPPIIRYVLDNDYHIK